MILHHYSFSTFLDDVIQLKIWWVLTMARGTWHRVRSADKFNPVEVQFRYNYSKRVDAFTFTAAVIDKVNEMLQAPSFDFGSPYP
jgi:hypothetical protein